MGLLSRYVWETAVENSDGPPDFEFDIVFTDSQSPLDPDWKPNGRSLEVRRRNNTDSYANNLEPDEKYYLYDYNFRMRSH
jgi:hypothetical protein